MGSESEEVFVETLQRSFLKDKVNPITTVELSNFDGFLLDWIDFLFRISLEHVRYLSLEN